MTIIFFLFNKFLFTTAAVFKKIVFKAILRFVVANSLSFPANDTDSKLIFDNLIERAYPEVVNHNMHAP